MIEVNISFIIHIFIIALSCSLLKKIFFNNLFDVLFDHQKEKFILNNKVSDKIISLENVKKKLELKKQFELHEIKKIITDSTNNSSKKNYNFNLLINKNELDICEQKKANIKDIIKQNIKNINKIMKN